MGPVSKAWLGVGLFAIFAVVVAAIYIVLMGGLPATRGSAPWPVIAINAVAACGWYAYVSTLKCRNCGVGFMAGAWGIGRNCRKCGRPL